MVNERIIHLIAYDQLKRQSLLETTRSLSNVNLLLDDLDVLFYEQDRFRSLLGALELKLGYLSEQQKKLLLEKENIGTIFEDVEMLLRDS
jgi:hypothetical protein